MNLGKPGWGHRTLVLAKTLGLSIDDPSLVVPLLIAEAKAQREADIRIVFGFAYTLANSFGKGDIRDWYKMLYPPSEIRHTEEEKRKRDAILRERAMLLKIQMMADRYDITEVRE